MSRPRYGWWGYVKDMIQRYPDNVNQNELEAVQAAVEATERMKNGRERLQVIDFVLWKGTHTIDGAALQIPCSGRTAQRWHAAFVKEVAKNFRCNGLI